MVSKREREIFSLDELIDVFDVSGICKSPAIFDIKKLAAINAKYIRNMSDEEFLKRATPFLNKAFSRDVDEKILVEILKQRTENFKDLEEQLDFIEKLPSYDTDLFVSKKMKTTKEGSLEVLKKVLEVVKNIKDFSLNSVHDAVCSLVEELGVKNGVVFWPLRVALSGKQFTPGGGLELCVLLGREESISRLEKAIEKLS